MSELLAGLETYLYVISSSLFYPVVIGLVALTFWIVFCFGSFLRNYSEKRRGESSALKQYRKDLEDELQRHREEGAEHLDARLERLLQESELKLVKQLDRVRFAVRAGPAVGLMGTLIPMGVALSSMAQGNMPKMAQSMVTAFTTTVVGLACGVAAYLMSLVQEKWVREDMREMEYETEVAVREVAEESGGYE
ncbi:MAG: MotA/TolQ/ExbB proton channel family protein [Candidatus Brocadiia bacterium]